MVRRLIFIALLVTSTALLNECNASGPRRGRKCRVQTRVSGGQTFSERPRPFFTGKISFGPLRGLLFFGPGQTGSPVSPPKACFLTN